MTAEAIRPPAEDVAHDLLHGIAREREAVLLGDELATERQHAKGKLTARERLELLLDAGSFLELDLFRVLSRAVIRKLARVPPDDALVEDTWIMVAE